MVITPGTGYSATSVMTVSTTEVVGGLAFFLATFLTPARADLSFAARFFGVALAALRFADFPRLDLEALRTLPRAVGVLFLTIARFFRWAMIATSSCVHPKMPCANSRGKPRRSD
jgi:hypothetical protein